MKSDVTPGMNSMRIHKIREVEQEFDEPFWDVVRGLAQMGCSRKEAAAIIGYSREPFYGLVRSRADIPWVPFKEIRGMKDRCVTEKWKKGVAMSNRKRARRYFVRGEWRLASEIARLAGITPNGMRARLASGWRGDALLAPLVSPTERGRRGAAVTNSKKNRRHIWGSGMSPTPVLRTSHFSRGIR